MYTEVRPSRRSVSPDSLSTGNWRFVASCLLTSPDRSPHPRRPKDEIVTGSGREGGVRWSFRRRLSPFVTPQVFPPRPVPTISYETSSEPFRDTLLDHNLTSNCSSFEGHRSSHPRSSDSLSTPRLPRDRRFKMCPNRITGDVDRVVLCGRKPRTSVRRVLTYTGEGEGGRGINWRG